jgi:hypothetical protein
MKTILTLQRLTGPGQPRTFGELRNPAGEFLVHTLEDMVREIPGEPWIKIKGETAIKAGLYKITLELSNRFGPDTLTVNDVDQFIGVRMHGGNTEKNTEGCPLLGMNCTRSGINTCKEAVDMIKKLVRDEIAAGNEVWMNIVNFED